MSIHNRSHWIVVKLFLGIRLRKFLNELEFRAIFISELIQYGIKNDSISCSVSPPVFSKYLNFFCFKTCTVYPSLVRCLILCLKYPLKVPLCDNDCSFGITMQCHLQSCPMSKFGGLQMLTFASKLFLKSLGISKASKYLFELNTMSLMSLLLNER